jgi:hypothetical protein
VSVYQSPFIFFNNPHLIDNSFVEQPTLQPDMLGLWSVLFWKMYSEISSKVMFSLITLTNIFLSVLVNLDTISYFTWSIFTEYWNIAAALTGLFWRHVLRNFVQGNVQFSHFNKSLLIIFINFDTFSYFTGSNFTEY